MQKLQNQSSIIFLLAIGIFMGLIAKLVDTPNITSRLPIFDSLMGRFGIWVWVATIIAVFSKKPILAAARSFLFFVGMLFAYYGYTILFLNFFPKSQILLWSVIALFTPVCGFIIWYINDKRWFASFLASLPLIIIFTEWYLTAKDYRLLFVVYLCMALSLLTVFPLGMKRLFSLFLALSASFILARLVQIGMIVNIYEKLLNVI